MKKTTKTLSILACSALLGTSLLGLAACGEQSYTVRVLLQDGSPAVHTQITLTSGENEYSAKTDQNGSASFTAPNAEYGVTLSNLPAGYTAESYTLKNQDLTINLGAPTLSTFTAGDGSQFPSSPDVGESGRYETPYGTYSVTIASADEELFFNLDPDSTGTFAVFTTGSADTVLKGYADYFADTEKDADNRSETNKNFYREFEFTDKYYSEYIRETIGVKARADSYPVTFNLTFTKISDEFTKEIEYERVEVKTSENLTQYAEGAENLNLVEAPYDSTIVYNETDGFFHIGGADGPTLVVKLTTNPSRLFARMAGEAGATFETANDTMPQMYYLTFEKEDGTLYYKDYNELIDEVYPQYVNSDGVYGVTKELKEFLYYYIVMQNNDVNIDDSVEKECRWLAPCYYYGYEAGTAENPNLITQRCRISLITPFGGAKTYYKIKMAAGNYRIYSVGDGKNDAKIYYTVNGAATSAGTGEGFDIIVNVPQSGYEFQLSAVDNLMRWFDVIVVKEGDTLPPEEGGEEKLSSYENPIVLTSDGVVTSTIPFIEDEANTWYGATYYAYEAPDDGTLAIELKTNSVYTVIYNETQNAYTHLFTATPFTAEEPNMPQDYAVSLTHSLEVNKGDVIRFTFRRMVEKSNANNDLGTGEEAVIIPSEAKELEFELSFVSANAEPDGSATNPYSIDEIGTHTRFLAAQPMLDMFYNGSMWITFKPTESGSYTFSIGDSSKNVLKVYSSPSTGNNALGSTMDSNPFSVSLTAGTTYYLYISWNIPDTIDNSFTGSDVTFSITK